MRAASPRNRVLRHDFCARCEHCLWEEGSGSRVQGSAPVSLKRHSEPRILNPEPSQKGSDPFFVRRRRRAGFSLLELILALAILCGAIAMLGELSRLGMTYADYARDATQAQLLCQGKLDEIVAGVSLPEAEQDVPFDPIDENEIQSEWLYSVEVAPLDEEGLTEVRVTVSQDVPAQKRPVEITLVRWMIDSSMTSSETGEEL